LELSTLPNVSIRLVPFGSGWHPGLSSSFKILNVDGKDHLYTETTGGGRLMTRQVEVRRFNVRFKQIGDAALNVSDSRDMISRRLDELS
jgi:hypothetical protein